jgi:putative transposase
MSNIRRYYIPDSIVFLTSVTRNRNELFLEKQNRILLFQTIDSVKTDIPFELVAYVILPDHFHFLIQLSNENMNFSKILQYIKGRFTHNYKKDYVINDSVSLWQRKFWDHIIRNERDLQNHLDYIHWNPVKHGFINEPSEWEPSSFNNWVEMGLYDSGWGTLHEPENIRKMDFE